MKRAASTVFLICSMSCWVAAQTDFVVSAWMNNFMYAGLENPVSIAVPNYPCSSLYVTTDNGLLSGKGCEYVSVPKEGNKVTFFVSVIENDDTISKGNWQFRVFSVPDPIATVAGRSNKYPEIQANLLLAVPIVQTEMERFDFDIHFKVTSFDMTIEKDNYETLTFHSNNSRFTEEMKDEVKTRSAGSTIKLFNIVVDGPDGTVRTIENLLLKIK